MEFRHFSLFAEAALYWTPAMTLFIAFLTKCPSFCPGSLFPPSSIFLYPKDQKLPPRDYGWNLPLAEQPLAIIKISPTLT